MFYKKSDLSEFESKYPNLRDVALETLEKCKNGSYENDDKENINIANLVLFCQKNSRAYPPDYKYSIPKLTSNNSSNIEISLETTIGASYRLIVQEGIKKTVALNFANPFEPGGGWLRGAPTQEESIVRCSSLITSLTQNMEGKFVEELANTDVEVNGKKYKNPLSFYLYNIELEEKKRMFASDYLILSPNVPVFRDDQLNFLKQPFELSVITSAAVLKMYLPNVDDKKINKIMLERIRKIIKLAIQEGYEAIVLGAFGCGAFANKSADVSKLFKKVLEKEGLQKYFKKITFAIFSPRNKSTIEDFCNTFDMQPI